jgi:GxxExxY protein
MTGQVVYPELSYQIIGILFEVWNEIGYSHKEKYIERAVAQSLIKNKILFKEQLKVDLNFNGNKIGVYFLDFLIDNKIILELKKKDFFSKNDINQVYNYLKLTGLKLGIIAHLTSKGVRFKRILNLS